MKKFLAKVFKEEINYLVQERLIESEKDIAERYLMKVEATKDIVRLTRHNLGGIDMVDVRYYEDMEQEEGKGLLREANSLSKNETLALILAELTMQQANRVIYEAKSLDEINFGRATINGIALVSDEIERLAALHLGEQLEDRGVEPTV